MNNLKAVNSIGDLSFLGVININPDIAKKILEKNIGNRPVRRERVESYKNELLKGHWDYMPEGLSITLDRNGVLLNGQHRLYAIIESGITKDFFLFQRNIDSNASIVICDNGMTRTALQILGIKNGLISATRFIIKTVNNNHDRVTELDIRNFLDLFTKEEFETFEKIVCRKKNLIPLKVAFFIRWFEDRNFPFEEILENLSNNVLSKNSPEQRIKNFLEQGHLGESRHYLIYPAVYSILKYSKISEKGKSESKIILTNFLNVLSSRKAL